MSKQLEIAYSAAIGLDLPSNWCFSTLADLVASENNAMTDGPFGSKLKSEHYVDEGVRVIRLGNIGVGGFKDDDKSFVTPEHAETLSRHSVRANDLLIAALAEPVGRCCQVPAGILPAIVKADCIRYRPHPLIAPRFVMHWMNSPVGMKNAEQHSHGVGRLRINMKEMRSLEVPLAPLSEQRRIVAEIEKQFTRLDAAVATLKRVQANLERARASVLKAAVEGRLVPTEAELARAEGRAYEPASVLLERILEERKRKHDEAQAGAKRKAKYKPPVAPDVEGLPDLPEGWTWASVEQLSSFRSRSIQSGPFGSSLLHSEFQSEGHLVIGIDNVLDGAFSMGAQHRISDVKFEQLKRFRARPLDVLITVMATVGRCCVVPENIEPAIITKHVYRITAEQGLVNPYFLMYMLKGAPMVRRQMFQEARGQTRLGLNGTIVKALVIPVPPISEQGRIVAEVGRQYSTLQSLQETVDRNLHRCNRLRQSILKRAFEGKLVPQDPTDEPASALLARIKAQTA